MFLLRAQQELELCFPGAPRGALPQPVHKYALIDLSNLHDGTHPSQDEELVAEPTKPLDRSEPPCSWCYNPQYRDGPPWKFGERRCSFVRWATG